MNKKLLITFAAIIAAGCAAIAWACIRYADGSQLGMSVIGRQVCCAASLGMLALIVLAQIFMPVED